MDLLQTFEKLCTANTIEVENITSLWNIITHNLASLNHALGHIHHINDKSNYLIEMCKHQRKINCTLTEIKFKMKKIIQSKIPTLADRNKHIESIDINELKKISENIFKKLDHPGNSYNEKIDTPLANTTIVDIKPEKICGTEKMNELAKIKTPEDINETKLTDTLHHKHTCDNVKINQPSAEVTKISPKMIEHKSICKPMKTRETHNVNESVINKKYQIMDGLDDINAVEVSKPLSLEKSAEVREPVVEFWEDLYTSDEDGINVVINDNEKVCNEDMLSVETEYATSSSSSSYSDKVESWLSRSNKSTEATAPSALQTIGQLGFFDKYEKAQINMKTARIPKLKLVPNMRVSQTDSEKLQEIKENKKRRQIYNMEETKSKNLEKKKLRKEKKVIVLKDNRKLRNSTKEWELYSYESGCKFFKEVLTENVHHLKIRDREIPKLFDHCMFSHIESPSEFYIQINDKESTLIDLLNEEIRELYDRSLCPYKSKVHAFEELGLFCVAHIKNEQYPMWCRIQVIDWCEENNTYLCVQMIDYGNVTSVAYTDLRSLKREFSFFPKLSVKCYLPLLYPPGSTKFTLLHDWPDSTISEFVKLSGLLDGKRNKSTIFEILYVERIGFSVAIDMHALEHVAALTIGQLLINLNHAVQIIEDDDDPEGVISDLMQIEELENCDNINEAIMGYDPKDEARICKFTRADGACFKGNNCKQEHTLRPKGGFTTDTVEVFHEAVCSISMPLDKEKISIRFTSMINNARFYVNFTKFTYGLEELNKVLNHPRTIKEYISFKIPPGRGEAVLVKHYAYEWQRAKVRHHNFDDNGHCTSVQVFMVDYGDIIDVPLKAIRHITENFLQFPFQAVEIMLYNYEHNGAFRKEMDTFFHEKMAFHPFTATLISRSETFLFVNVHDADGQNIGSFLESKKFVKKISTSFQPLPNLLILPG